MKKITVSIIILGVLVFLAQNTFAIGQWHNGTVTKVPWVDQYTYIKIDHVKYTIMKGAKILKVSQKKGAYYRDQINLYSIFDGDKLVYKNEGNRIYQIEKIR